jgi:DNA replication protein DnaC
MPEVTKPWLAENADCQRCWGTQQQVFEENGIRFAKQCPCVEEMRVERNLKRSNLPEGCEISLNNWNNKGLSSSQVSAYYIAVDFAKQHPVLNKTKGIIFSGKIGIGKTHLAIGLLKALMTNQKCTGIYYRQGALLELIKSSFDDDYLSERDILRPLKTRDVVLLDDVGTSRPTDWVVEKMLDILAVRYENKKTTIITTNYPVMKTIREEGELKDGRGVGGVDTLGDRIGNRAVSRLSEMCQVVNMNGSDRRFAEKKAEAIY